MDERGTPERPIWMAVAMPPPDIRRVVSSIALAVIPVGIAILMQRPALRQALMMRVTYHAWQISEQINNHVTDLSLRLATAYQKARL